MKFIHLSDLHLGKRVYEYSLLEDQQYILEQIVNIIRAEAPDAVLIAGDVYDRAIPPEEAVRMFDRFLVELADMGTPVFISSGNHDSPERLAFGSRLMKASGIHFAPAYRGVCSPDTLQDAHGPVDIYMLPHIRPAVAKHYFPEREITDYSSAVAAVLAGLPLQPGRRNVLLAHQFVAGGLVSDSEERYVGGSEDVSAALFDGFDYVALGHLHRPQNVGGDRIRYCGTQLKYSFSECGHQKSVTVAELGEKGSLALRTLPLTPLRDMAQLRGSFAQLTARAFWEGTTLPEDYVHIVLTDEDEVPEAIGHLRPIYKNMMLLTYDNARTRSSVQITGDTAVRTKAPMTLFEEFFEMQNNQPMSPEQAQLVAGLIERIWREDA